MKKLVTVGFYIYLIVLAPIAIAISLIKVLLMLAFLPCLALASTIERYRDPKIDRQKFKPWLAELLVGGAFLLELRYYQEIEATWRHFQQTRLLSSLPNRNSLLP